MNRPKDGAGLRANDPVELSETEAAKDKKTGKVGPTPKASDLDEASAESGPELRDVPMGNGVDHADGEH